MQCGGCYKCSEQANMNAKAATKTNLNAQATICISNFPQIILVPCVTLSRSVSPVEINTNAVWKLI